MDRANRILRAEMEDRRYANKISVRRTMKTTTKTTTSQKVKTSEKQEREREREIDISVGLIVCLSFNYLINQTSELTYLLHDVASRSLARSLARSLHEVRSSSPTWMNLWTMLSFTPKCHLRRRTQSLFFPAKIVELNLLFAFLDKKKKKKKRTDDVELNVASLPELIFAFLLSYMRTT